MQPHCGHSADSTQPLPLDPFDDAAIGMAFVSAEGRFQRVNQALCDLLARDSATLLGMTWADVTDLDDSGTSRRLFDELIAGTRPRLDFEKRYVRPDGSRVTARVASSTFLVDGVVTIFSQITDVTDEHDALAALLASETRWRAFADSSADVSVWLRLVPDLTVVYVSDNTTSVSGYTPEAFYADPSLVMSAVHPDDRELVSNILATPGALDGALVRWVCPDGRIKWMEHRVTTLAAAAGVVTDVLLVARDVTPRIASEAELSRHDAQQRAIADFAQDCIRRDRPEDVLTESCDLIASLVPVDVACVWWEVSPGGAFRLAAGKGFSVLEVGRAIVSDDMSHAARVRSNDSVTTFQPNWGDDTTYSELYEEGLVSGVGVPIRQGGRLVGVVAAYARNDRMASAFDVTFLTAIATSVGALADRADYDQRFAYQSLHDSLTGLPNRTLLLGHLAQALTAGRRIAVAHCDIDDFNVFNEVIGIESGDHLLRQVAQRLLELPSVTFVARIGGDAFAVVMDGTADTRLEDLPILVTSAMAEQFDLDGRFVSATLSAGVATTETSSTVDELLAEALAASQRAKARGRGQWQYASRAEQSAAIHRFEMASALRTAIDDGSVQAYFQPIVRLGDQRLVGFEALARWTSADGFVAPPAEFIPVAEEAGLVDALGLSMLEQACVFLERSGSERHLGDLKVTINVSARQLEAPDFCERVEAILDRHAVQRSSICLELTESAMVPNDDDMVRRLHDLRRIGVSLAIDDFGTGYSSLAYLTSFPIDLLKLDRALVTDIAHDSRRLKVAGAIIGLARALDITVVAEGIENEGDFVVLAGLGCDLGQGWLWSPALPAAEAATLEEHSLVRTVARVAPVSKSHPFRPAKR